ncbi:MAG: nitroreductase family protein [candidate division WOR-3 bacterium]|nr:MAG: nitroreductase family protein [candidate division WOR-3 bacterium]
MSYLQYFTKPIDETIRERTSCRTYKDKLLSQNDKKELLDFGMKLNKGIRTEQIHYQLAEFSVEELKERKMSAYWLFKNLRSFVVGMIDKTDFHQMSYGYAMEHIVLKATELGLGTCWAGYFDPRAIEGIKIKENHTIPAIILIGYAAEERSVKERIARFAIRASKRHDWSKLFFLGEFSKVLNAESAGPYAEVLELLRLAPSAGNTQPWRIIKDKSKNIYHFFKKVVNPSYERKKLHDIDIGIAMCHFELGAAHRGLRGKWMQADPQLTGLPSTMHYMATWIHDT